MNKFDTIQIETLTRPVIVLECRSNTYFQFQGRGKPLVVEGILIPLVTEPDANGLLNYLLSVKENNTATLSIEVTIDICHQFHRLGYNFIQPVEKNLPQGVPGVMHFSVIDEQNNHYLSPLLLEYEAQSGVLIW